MGFARRIGQIPIRLRRESFGYVFNALYNAINREALTLVANRIASVEDVDRAWMGIMKMPVDPFGMLDGVGLEHRLAHHRLLGPGERVTRSCVPTPGSSGPTLTAVAWASRAARVSTTTLILPTRRPVSWTLAAAATTTIASIQPARRREAGTAATPGGRTDRRVVLPNKTTRVMNIEIQVRPAAGKCPVTFPGGPVSCG